MTQEAATYQEGSARRKWMVLAILCLPLFILSLDNSVLNLALPSIARDLGSRASQLQWIVDAYILAFASLLLVSGAIGDRYGRKRLFQIGLALFCVGSLCAALSNSTGMLIFFRGFSGFAGAMVMPSILSLVVNTFPNPKERAQALGIWAAVFALGASIGPLVGGTILGLFHWGAVFLINLPVVAITLILARFFLSESKGDDAPKPDILGMLLSTIGLFVLVYGIIQAGEKGWTDSAVLTYLGMGIFTVGLFTVAESKVAHPMLPLAFFKNKSFSVASSTMIMSAFGIASAAFFWSQYFQSVQGYSPISSAIRTMPTALIMFMVSIMSARIAGRIGIKLSISIGIFLSGMAFLYLSQILEVNTPYLSFFIGIVLIGVGLGMTSAPATNCVVGSVPMSRAGVASAMNNVTRQLGQALGVAVLGTVLNAIYRGKIDEITALPSLTGDAVGAIRSSIQSAHIVAGDLPVDIATTINDRANEAFVLGMNHAMFLGALVFCGAAFFSLILLPSKIQRPER